jgi:glycosyltransferase involved in cell wall biosynthesis
MIKDSNIIRPRILFVQKPPGGGSATGLYDLVLGINKNLYEPIVLLYEKNLYYDIFKELGVEVLYLFEIKNSTGEINSLNKPNILTGTGISGIQIIRFSKKIYRLIKELPIAWRLSRIIKKHNIDIVHHNNDLSLNRASVLASVIAGIPQICHVRWLTDYKKDKFSAFIDYKISKHVDFFIYMSKAIEHTYLDLGISDQKGAIINDPFDLKIYSNAIVNAEKIRKEFNLIEDEALIVNVGRIMPWKGQIYFIEAMATVLHLFPSVKALIVGAPEPGQGSISFYEKLKMKVNELGISNNVIFTGFRQDIPDIMAASNIMVHSSSEPEPFGRVIVEAMASECAVIATNAGGAAEIFENQITGILVQPKNSESISTAIIRLLRDKGFSKRMGQLAKIDVQSRFNIEQHVIAVQEIYNNILSK